MAQSHIGLDAEDENLEVSVQRTPTVLVLDTSGSMNRKTTSSDGNEKPKIDQLNNGLDLFRNEVLQQDNAADRVDVALVEFGSDATVHQDFTNIQDWSPPKLDADGSTPMGEAIKKAIDLSEDVKDFYHQEGISYTRPLIWLLTDGKPTDMNEGDSDWTEVTEQLHVGTRDNHFLFLAMGVNGAEMDTLQSLVDGTNRPALEMQEGMFSEYFEFISNSLEAASREEGMADELGDTDQLQEFVQTDTDE